MFGSRRAKWQSSDGRQNKWRMSDTHREKHKEINIEDFRHIRNQPENSLSHM